MEARLNQLTGRRPFIKRAVKQLRNLPAHYLTGPTHRARQAALFLSAPAGSAGITTIHTTDYYDLPTLLEQTNKYQLNMLFSTVLAVITFFCALFINVSSKPTPDVVARRAVSGPRSLMGRAYFQANEARNDNITKKWAIPRSVLPCENAGAERITTGRRRTYRLQALQRRKAQGTELETEVVARK